MFLRHVTPENRALVEQVFVMPGLGSLARTAMNSTRMRPSQKLGTAKPTQESASTKRPMTPRQTTLAMPRLRPMSRDTRVAPTIRLRVTPSRWETSEPTV